MVHPKRVLLCGLASTALLTGGCASPAQRFNPPGAVSESGRYAGWSRPLSRTHVSAIVERIRQRSQIVAGAGRGRLLYVADPFANAVLIYTYPQLSGAGELTGFTSVTGVCTDRRGYVWVLDTNDVLAWEFPHGGTTPIASLRPSGDSTGNPGVGKGCAVDTKSGDLAVAGAGPGITVFRNGQNTDSTYWDFTLNEFDYIGYDGAGNVFVDGDAFSAPQFHLDELTKGSSNLSRVTLSGGTIGFNGGIQWDGKQLDIADAGSGALYQTNGSAILATICTGNACQAQFFVVPNRTRLVDPDPCSASTPIYAYPAGGAALKTVSGGQQDPVG